MSEGKWFIGLARLVVVFHVGLAQLFVGVVLLDFPVGISFFLFGRWQIKKAWRWACAISYFVRR